MDALKRGLKRQQMKREILKILLIFAFIMLSFILNGCRKHCDDLLKATCEKYGLPSKPCNEMQEMAERADGRDQKSCKLALEIINESK